MFVTHFEDEKLSFFFFFLSFSFWMLNMLMITKVGFLTASSFCMLHWSGLLWIQFAARFSEVSLRAWLCHCICWCLLLCCCLSHGPALLRVPADAGGRWAQAQGCTPPLWAKWKNLPVHNIKVHQSFSLTSTNNRNVPLQPRKWSLSVRLTLVIYKGIPHWRSAEHNTSYPCKIEKMWQQLCHWEVWQNLLSVKSHAKWQYLE